MTDLLVSSYFSILGAMCGFALLRAMMKIDYRCFAAIFLIVVFVFSFTMATATAGAWNGSNLLLTVVLSCICTLTFYLAYISRVKLTDEYLEDPWGRRVLGVMLLCFALLFKADIVELARALPKAMINLRGIGLLILSMACMGVVGAGMIVYKKDMPSFDAGRSPITPLPISRSIIMVIICFMMTAFLFIVINFILHK